MKNLSKQILLLVFISTLLLNTAFGQASIAVFNTPVNLRSSLVVGEYATGYPTSIGASHLRNCSAIYLKRSDLTSILNAVRSSLVQSSEPSGVPVFCGFFTTEYDADTLTVLKNKTHGLCFGFQSGSTLTLYYYEKNAAGTYDRIDKLATRINEVSDNLFMSLHYSYFESGAFPDKSTIFRFVCDSIKKVGDNDNSSLTVLLSKDYKRQTGLYSAGMAQPEILQDCEGPITGDANCGNPCLVTPSTECVYVTDINGYFIYTCRAAGRGTCAAGSIDKRARDENITLGVPIRYKRMRDFRDKFMTKYCEGRKYIGFYYTFSKYAKLDISMLWKYAFVLPDLYAAMENLRDESTDKVIFTPSLREKVLEILRNHKDVDDAYFQSILNEVEKDLEIFTGLTRSEVISMLSPYGSCNGGRNALNGEAGSNSYFATAYYNPASEEINVNYSVPGTAVKFELFSATAGLLISSNIAPQQKNLKVAAKQYDPGIYIYRICSDSGYEKTGKLVIVK